MDRVFILRGDFEAKQLAAFLKANRRAMAALGTPLQVSVGQHRAKRSTEANALYWSILSQVAEQAWVGGRQYTSDLWHRWYAGRFIGYEEGPDGMQSPLSTTKLDTAQFAEYCDRVMAHAATELGCELDVGVPL